MKFIYYLILFIFIQTNSAHAYLDPATASIILKATLAFLAAIGTTITFYWEKTKELFKKFINIFLSIIRKSK